jgi:prepilin-type N-terminal cleavage/methylation domain-containing protein
MKLLRTRNGFTLIELLTVIAIIAILAALIFPTFARVGEQRRQDQCIQQMQEIGRALQQYQMDNGKYPASLLGLAQYMNNQSQVFYTGSGGTPVSINQLTYRPLMTGQKYIQDISVFHCPDAATSDQQATTAAVYPPNLPLSGTAQYTATVAHNLSDSNLQGQPMYFYTYDSYDVGPQVDKNGNAVMQNGSPVMELHYSLDWTGVTGPDDNPNQLKYPSPPADHTVVTWCTDHVATAHSNVVTVLLLSGTAKAVPVDRFVNSGPLNFSF